MAVSGQRVRSVTVIDGDSRCATCVDRAGYGIARPCSFACPALRSRAQERYRGDQAADVGDQHHDQRGLCEDLHLGLLALVSAPGLATAGSRNHQDHRSDQAADVGDQHQK